MTWLRSCVRTCWAIMERCKAAIGGGPTPPLAMCRRMHGSGAPVEQRKRALVQPSGDAFVLKNTGKHFLFFTEKFIP